MGLCLDMEMARTEKRNKVKGREIFQTIYANILLTSNMSFQQSYIICSETKSVIWRLRKLSDLLFQTAFVFCAHRRFQLPIKWKQLI